MEITSCKGSDRLSGQEGCNFSYITDFVMDEIGYKLLRTLTRGKVLKIVELDLTKDICIV